MQYVELKKVSTPCETHKNISQKLYVDTTAKELLQLKVDKDTVSFSLSISSTPSLLK